MNPQKLFQRVLQGETKNVSFDDFVRLVERFAFVQVRARGSHQLFQHPTTGARLNLQERDGEAKPYQIKQFLKLVEEHNLDMRRGK